LSEVIASANLDPVAVSMVTKHVDEMLEQKNQFIKDLQFELAKITKV
jgi:growth arrest-specific protein 8